MRLTSAMRRTDAELRRCTGLGLRDTILARTAANPALTLPALAEDLGVDKVTLYRWLDRLQIGIAEGPRLIDIQAKTLRDGEAQADAIVAQIAAEEAGRAT